MDYDPKLSKPVDTAKPRLLSKPKLLDREPSQGLAKGSPQSKVDHMARRKADGLSHREVAKEFGVSKSTSHRLTGNKPKAID